MCQEKYVTYTEFQQKLFLKKKAIMPHLAMQAVSQMQFYNN